MGRKLVISLAYFDDIDDAKPERVANIGFIERAGPESNTIRLAVKESGTVILDQEFCPGSNLVQGAVQNGLELLYGPDKLVSWLVGLIKRNAVSALYSLADVILRPKDAARTGGGQNVQS